MKNNNGNGLYDIGQRSLLPCGCISVAEAVGYTHYIKEGCPFDDKPHPPLRGYEYRPMRDLPNV